jgi:hypothetical protein
MSFLESRFLLGYIFSGGRVGSATLNSLYVFG